MSGTVATAAATNRPALWAFILGILSIAGVVEFVLVDSFTYGMEGVIGVAAIVLGRAGFARAQAGAGRRELAVVGMVLGVVSALSILLIVAAWLVAGLTGRT